MAKVVDFVKLKKVVEHYHKIPTKATAGFHIEMKTNFHSELIQKQPKTLHKSVIALLHSIYKSSNAFLSEITSEATDRNLLVLQIGTETYSLSHLRDLDTSFFKSSSIWSGAESNCWEMTTGAICNDEYTTNLCHKIKSHMNLQHIELSLDRIVLIDNGGKYTPKQLDKEYIGRALVMLPSEHTGGEVLIEQTRDYFHTVSTVDLSQVSNQLNWLAVFGNCWKGTNLVTSGSQLLIIFNIKLPLKPTLLQNSVESMNVFKGLVDTSVQQHFTRHLARTLIETKTSFGFVLSEQYSEADYPLESLNKFDLLKGTDKILVQTLKQVGCVCSIQPVMVFRERNQKTVVCPLSDPLLPAFLTPKRELEILQYPFFMVHKIPLVEPPPNWSEMKAKMNKEGNLDLICQSELEEGYAFTLAVIVEYPKWYQQKLLMLARMKNDPSWCPLASLPLDLLKTIWNLVDPKEKKDSTRSEVVEPRINRRKRSHSWLGPMEDVEEPFAYPYWEWNSSTPPLPSDVVNLLVSPSWS